jgi:thiamine pyrophosphate-dependent acetolactate synthase large subunit-like protein
VIKRHKDWTLLARGNGFAAEMAERVPTPVGLEAILRRTVAHRRPHLLELITPYEECLPLMPPGKSFNEMIVDV